MAVFYACAALPTITDTLPEFILNYHPFLVAKCSGLPPLPKKQVHMDQSLDSSRPPLSLDVLVHDIEHTLKLKCLTRNDFEKIDMYLGVLENLEAEVDVSESGRYVYLYYLGSAVRLLRELEIQIENYDFWVTHTNPLLRSSIAHLEKCSSFIGFHKNYQGHELTRNIIKELQQDHSIRPSVLREYLRTNIIPLLSIFDKTIPPSVRRIIVDCKASQSSIHSGYNKIHMTGTIQNCKAIDRLVIKVGDTETRPRLHTKPISPWTYEFECCVMSPVPHASGDYTMELVYLFDGYEFGRQEVAVV